MYILGRYKGACAKSNLGLALKPKARPKSRPQLGVLGSRIKPFALYAQNKIVKNDLSNTV